MMSELYKDQVYWYFLNSVCMVHTVEISVKLFFWEIIFSVCRKEPKKKKVFWVTCKGRWNYYVFPLQYVYLVFNNQNSTCFRWYRIYTVKAKVLPTVPSSSPQKQLLSRVCCVFLSVFMHICKWNVIYSFTEYLLNTHCVQCVALQ